MSPLVHFFTTKKNYYIYDAPTNEILRVDKESWSIFRDILLNSLSTDVLENKYSKKVVKEATDKISELKKEGLFKNNFSFPIDIPYSDEELISFLRTNMNTLVLEVTQNCNFRCRYCTYSGNYYNYRSHGPYNMSKEIMKSAIKLLSERSENADKINIGFYGGEPLLNFEVIKYGVRVARTIFNGKQINFSITTNGSLINKTIAKYFKDNNFIVHISLDGPPQIHNRWRRTIQNTPTYHLTMKGIRTLYKYDSEYFKNNVGFQAVLAPSYPYKDVSKFFQETEIIKECGLLSHLVNRFGTTIDYSLTNKERARAKEEREWLKEQYKFAIIRGEKNKLGSALFEDALRKIHRRNMGSVSSHWVNGVCVPGLAKIFVDVNGIIYMCEKIGQNFPLGDVQKGFNEELSLKLLRDYCKFSSNDCSKCWAYHFCSLCFVSAAQNNSFNVNRKRKYCENMKSFISEMLELYCEILEEDPHALDFLINDR